ncbi:hypothetical protein [Actinokineospora iranica]|uniref:Secreted protein n=1 Tax=Actinokineospora iranica TaxID=1271860 RepID=A0A1G6Z1H8_9PSEU|nr:hypothetical protein [Actinokineospora iranica]SDD95725.1 hypothetical protein SAMN05216174_12458 [Actinokineospora iranica]
MLKRMLKVASVTILAVIAVLAPTAVAVAEPVAPPAVSAVSDTTVDLGGVNLKSYCQYHGFDDVTLLPPKDVYSWRCHLDGEVYGIDMYDACWWQYRRPSRPDFYEFKDPYSWYCWI